MVQDKENHHYNLLDLFPLISHVRIIILYHPLSQRGWYQIKELEVSSENVCFYLLQIRVLVYVFDIQFSLTTIRRQFL